MPQDMNSDPTSQGQSDTSWDKGQSTSIQDDIAHARDEAGHQASGAYEQAKDSARSWGNEAKERASRYAEDQKDAVSHHLDDFAQAIKRASDELNERDQTMASQLIRQAASGLEGLSRSVRGSSIDDMLASVRAFGRRNPTAFIGGAVLAGLALGRFARASSDHRSSRSHGSEYDQDWQGPGGSGGSNRYGDAESWSGSGGGAPAPYRGSSESYLGGTRSGFAPATRGTADAPQRSQGYAGGGMSSDPIQSSTSSSPSSASNASVTTSTHSGGGAQPGSISTGEQS